MSYALILRYGPTLSSSTILSILALMTAGPAGAQPSAGAVAGLVSESVDVRLIEIDARVSDRKGRPVTGLERADFEVLLDGTAVPIVNFYAVEGPAVPAEVGASGAASGARPLELAILVDSSNVEIGARNMALDRVRDFLRTQLSPEDRVMLVSTSPSAGLSTPAFTDRLDRIEQELDRIAATPAWDRRAAEFREILREIGVSLSASGASVQGRMRGLEARIRAFSAEASRDTARVAADLRQVVEHLADLPGRKALLYLGGGLSLRPGEALSGALAQALGRFAALLPEGSPVPDLPGRSAEDDAGELLALARHASVRDVAFYAVALGASGPEMSLAMSRGSAEAGAGSAPGQEESWAPAVGVSRRFDLESSLQLLAGATGGLAANGRRLGRLLERLRDDARAFYSLGVEPPEGDPGKAYRLEVRVRSRSRGRGLRVRHRGTFRATGRDRDAAVAPPRVATKVAPEVEPTSGPIPRDPDVRRPKTGRPRKDRAAADLRGKGRRKVRLPEVETATGYARALRRLAAGATAGAREALAELEATAVPDAAYDQLAAIESGVLRELEEASVGGLLPVALLYADMIEVYRRRGLAPLAEHALRTSRRLAQSVARDDSDPELRAVAGRTLTELAGALTRAGRLVEARDLFELALAAQPGNAVARLGLGFCHERAGAYAAATEALEPLAEAGHAEARLRLAIHLERLGKTGRSRPLLEAASRPPAPDWIALLAVQESARIATRERRFDDAMSLLASALERWPGHPGLELQQAYLLDRRGASRQARETVTRLVAAGATDFKNPRHRYGAWPADEVASRELRAVAGAYLAELGRALETVAP